jgi:predicted CopG family antitoxin
MATTIQVSETLVAKLKRAKEEMGVRTYEDVIERLLRQREVMVRSRRGSRPWLQWNKDTDRMKLHSEE